MSHGQLRVGKHSERRVKRAREARSGETKENIPAAKGVGGMGILASWAGGWPIKESRNRTQNLTRRGEGGLLLQQSLLTTKKGDRSRRGARGGWENALG